MVAWGGCMSWCSVTEGVRADELHGDMGRAYKLMHGKHHKIRSDWERGSLDTYLLLFCVPTNYSRNGQTVSITGSTACLSKWTEQRTRAPATGWSSNQRNRQLASVCHCGTTLPLDAGPMGWLKELVPAGRLKVQTRRIFVCMNTPPGRAYDSMDISH